MAEFELRRDAPSLGCRGEPLSKLDRFLPAFTLRQRDVLRELAKGQSNKQIGRALALSPETVNHHLKAIYLKLDVSTREDAVVEARRRGIIA